MKEMGFCGGKIIRDLDAFTSFADLIVNQSTLILFIADRKVFTQLDNPHSLQWHHISQLSQLDICVVTGPVENNDTVFRTSTTDQTIPLYYLGYSINTTDQKTKTFYITADTSNIPLFSQNPQFKDLRSLLTTMPSDDLAHAGRAVSLAQWHRTYKYCPRCGSSTQAIQGGAKRLCSKNNTHKMYPRSDPVVISLVSNIDNTKILLCRGRNFPIPNMLTCISGFIDHGESIEEAVVREVLEESGINLLLSSSTTNTNTINTNNIRVVGSQPWPLGRGGSHELMIGCIAQYNNNDDTITMSDELVECRWVERSLVKKALDIHNNTDDNSTTTDIDIDFVVPPPVTLAYQLMYMWIYDEQCSHDTTTTNTGVTTTAQQRSCM